MTKQELSQLRYLNKEIERLKNEVEKLKADLRGKDKRDKYGCWVRVCPTEEGEYVELGRG